MLAQFSFGENEVEEKAGSGRNQDPLSFVISVLTT